MVPLALIDPNDVLKWIRDKKEVYVNARKVARKFKISTKSAGHILRKLKEKGYLKLHSRRKGRFNVYKVKWSNPGLRKRK